MSKKLVTIIEGALVIALGVLIAVFGGVKTLSTYFGVLFIIAGAGLLAFDVAVLCRCPNSLRCCPPRWKTK